MSDQQRGRVLHWMDQDSWIARHKLLAALFVALSGPAGFALVWLLSVIL